MSNSQRFISAYNLVDKRLRSVYGLKASITFTDAIRKAAVFSPLVRKFEDELYDYGRLRNAIVHNSSSDIAIAEPHSRVVEHFEHIAELISTPPLAIDTVAKMAFVYPSAELLSKAIAIMTDNNYSNLPLIKDGIIVGVLTNKGIVEAVAKRLNTSSDFFQSAKAIDAMQAGYSHYEIVKHNVNLDEVLNLFTSNRKLSIVILTDNGAPSGRIKGIVTTGDILDIQSLLDNY